MHAPLPLLAPLLWFRFLLAGAIIVWLPGHLVTGRWLKSLALPDRIVLSISVGLILPFVYAAGPGLWGAPFSPAWYLAFVLPGGFLLGLWPAHRRAQSAWTGGLAALDDPGKGPSLASLAAIAAALFSLIALLSGYGHLPAPPHIHDASNHAWITLRIVQSQALDWRELAQDAAGTLNLGYLPGLHAAAALIAGLGGLAPYISIWMSAIALAVLVPLSWILLWRAWGASPSLVAIAVLISVTNSLGPGGVLNWGGFGQLAGFFFLPAAVLALHALTIPRRDLVSTLWGAFFTGVVLAGLLHLHATEVLVAGLFAAIAAARSTEQQSQTSLGAGNEPDAPDKALFHRGWLPWIGLAVLTGFFTICGSEVWSLVRSYPHAIDAQAIETKTLGDSLHRLFKAGGHGTPMRLLVLAGWLLALRARQWRPAALAATVLGVWYLSLQSFADPLSRWLGTPFYRQAPRILYLQLYFLPLWAAIALLGGAKALGRRIEILRERREEIRLQDEQEEEGKSPATPARKPRPGTAVASLLILAVLTVTFATDWRSLVMNYRNGGKAVPFTLDDYRQAGEIARLVPSGAMVANLWDDGSTWAMHVSRRPFLLPCAWDLSTSDGQSLHGLARGLARSPWPEATARLLQQHSIHYLYVSDGVWRKGSGLRRADFDDDSRFEPIAVGELSTLYRIHMP